MDDSWAFFDPFEDIDFGLPNQLFLIDPNALDAILAPSAQDVCQARNAQDVCQAPNAQDISQAPNAQDVCQAPNAQDVINKCLRNSWVHATRATAWEEWNVIESRQAKRRRQKRLPCVQIQKPYGVTPMPPLLPEHIRALVNTFCHPSIRRTMLNNPNLYKDLRLYVRFGEVSPPGEAKSTELSRPVYFDQLLKGIRSEMNTRAKQMAVTLAIIHCKCKYDAAGVKFQLALHPTRRKVMLWPTNFDHCKTFKSSSENIDLELALAIAKNPTWPRPPGMFGFLKRDDRLALRAWDTWFTFRDAYVSACYKLKKPKFSPTNVMNRVLGIYNPNSTCYDSLPVEERISQVVPRLWTWMNDLGVYEQKGDSSM